jgi:hypothetical protein
LCSDRSTASTILLLLLDNNIVVHNPWVFILVSVF